MGAIILTASAEALASAEPVAQAAASTDIPTWFVVVMGMGIVFAGLISLIILISLMGSIMKRFSVNQEVRKPVADVTAPVPVAHAPGSVIPNRGELVAAISVALAEELGKDVKAIRIHSIKRV